MKVEVIASVMNQKPKDYSILEKMNINTNAIIVNQCDRNSFEEIEYKKHKIKFLSFDERGVGLSRNNGLMRANSDIVLFADEDITYVDNYQKIVADAFLKNPKAEMIVFNVPSMNENRPTYIIKKNKRVRKFNCLRYGAVKFAIKLDAIRKYNVYFSLLFGGGAKYGSGEDSLFIYEFIKKGGKVYSNNSIIGYVSQEDSTWFNGYNEKYFKDKGMFFYCLSKRWQKFLCLQLLIRHKEMYKSIGLKKAYLLMISASK